MPRQATGELRVLATGFEARICIQGRERKGFFLPMCRTKEEAKERCESLASIAARLRKAPALDSLEVVRTLKYGAEARAGRAWEAFLADVEDLCAGATEKIGAAKVPTMTEFCREWTSGELARKYPDHVDAKDSENDRRHFANYIEPHVGGVRVDEFRLEDAERVMASLPAVSPRTGRPLRPATRRHVGQVLRRLMAMAVYPCRHREHSPIPSGWLPGLGSQKAKACLYPNEDRQLLDGVSAFPGKPGVPLLRRLAYGFLAREGLRRDEMATLRWRDVDLERGTIFLDSNKTDDPREWKLRPDVVRALTAWKKRQAASVITECDEPTSCDAKGKDLIFAEAGVPLNVEHLSEQFRADLVRVGVERPQLFERSDVRQPIRIHDLRSTFVTIALATGKTETWVQDRTGHTSSEMVNRYRRKGRSWELGELGPLDECIPEFTIEGEFPREVPTNTSRRWRNWQTRQIQVLVGLLL